MNIDFRQDNPSTTIANISTFFDSHGFLVQEMNSGQNKVNIYQSQVMLAYDSTWLFRAQGQGLTYEEAVATAYSELYERYCSIYPIVNNPFLNKVYQELIPQNYMTQQEVLNDNNIASFLQSFGQDNINNILNIICGDNIAAYEYTNLLNPEEKKNYNLNLLYKITNGRFGIAAGGSQEEAMVCAISEAFEMGVYYKLLTEPQQKYYYINNNILSPALQSIIQKINEQDDSKVLIFDLSYNFRLPVCFIVIEHKQLNKFFYSYAAAPTIDLAVERGLKKIYQGNSSLYESSKEFSIIQQPSSTVNLSKYYIDSIYAYEKNNVIPENIILNKELVEEINTQVFMIDSEENNNYLEHYKELLEEQQLTLYYKDYSQTNNIFTIHVYIPELISPAAFSNGNAIGNIVKEYYNLLSEVLSENTDEQKIYQSLNYINQNYNTNFDVYMKKTMGIDWFRPYITQYDNLHTYKIIENLFTDENIKNNFIINKYFGIYNYLKNGYSEETTYLIFKELNPLLTMEEVSKCNNLNYVIYKTILLPLKEIYTEDNIIENFIKTYQKDDKNAYQE